MSSHSIPARGRLAPVDRDRLARAVLTLDAVVTGANGLVYVAAAGALDSLLGVPAEFLRSIGAFLLAFAAMLWYLATREVVRPAALGAVAAANVAWVVASVGFLVGGWYSPSTVGAVWTGLQAAVVALFAVLQLIVLAATSKSEHSGAARRIGGLLARRWPTWLALALVVVSVGDGEPVPVDTFAWLMLTQPIPYLLFGTARKEWRPPSILMLQLGALAFYVALTAIALSLDDDIARYVVAAGWIAHAGWDAAHHRAKRVVPRAYAEWCFVVDVLLGVAIIVLR